MRHRLLTVLRDGACDRRRGWCSPAASCPTRCRLLVLGGVELVAIALRLVAAIRMLGSALQCVTDPAASTFSGTGPFSTGCSTFSTLADPGKLHQAQNAHFQSPVL